LGHRQRRIVLREQPLDPARREGRDGGEGLRGLALISAEGRHSIR
jgi:hypothetical protein